MAREKKQPAQQPQAPQLHEIGGNEVTGGEEVKGEGGGGGVMGGEEVKGEGGGGEMPVVAGGVHGGVGGTGGDVKMSTTLDGILDDPTIHTRQSLKPTQVDKQAPNTHPELFQHIHFHNNAP